MKDRTLDSRIARDALGFLLIATGLVWLVAVTAASYLSIDGPYVIAVIGRSLGSPFQAIMLAALLIVFPHYIWVRRRYGPASLPAYETFGYWAQTLFTSFGFLGTIVGVSLAVAGLEAAMMEGTPSELIGGLSTAFDTTFVGLTGAICLMICRKLASLTLAT